MDRRVGEAKTGVGSSVRFGTDVRVDSLSSGRHEVPKPGSVLGIPSE